MKNKMLILGIAALCVLSPLGAKAKKNEKSEKKLTIVTTMFPQYDFARAVAGDKVDITMLLKPGAESHSYEPTPRDMKKVQNADLFIYNGGENDEWVESILESQGKAVPKSMKFLDFVDVKEEELVEGMTEEEEESEEEEVELDEHVWTSPINAIKIVNAIKDELCAIDEANAEVYANNAASYCKQIEDLNEEFKTVVKDAKRKTLVFGDRFPFRYFADDYGLSYFAAFPGCATDVEASASTIKFLINKVKEENIPVVFAIEFSNKKIANTICEATGAKCLEFHSCHNISADELKKGETYVSLMKRNVAVLKEALE